MKNIKRAVLAALASVMVLGGAVACGSDNDYRPAAYGENGQCYFVDDPREVDVLYQNGNCPRDWRPVIMPLFWHQQYYPYYSSPAYYNTYVPVSSRTVYVERSTNFGSTYASQIKTASSQAKYTNSKGKVVPGNKVAPNKFGGGSRQKSGSNNSRQTCGMSLNGAPIDLLGSGSGSGGGSRSSSGGGSRSSGGSSKSTTPNKSTNSDTKKPNTTAKC